MKSGEKSPDAVADAALLEQRFVRDPSMVFRRIADETILVPIRRKVGDVESLYTLNEVGARIWELIDGVRPVEQIRDLIVSEFEVSQGEAERDLLTLFRQFREIGAISEAAADGA